MKLGAIAVAAAALMISGCAATLASAPVAGGGPVVGINSDFPDPAVLLADDGFYYAYATQTERDGQMVNLQVARSRDLMDWELLADGLPVKPGWASRTQDFWAPHVTRAGDRYILYYSAKPDAALDQPDRGLCLAVATADRPQGPFKDIGKPLLCGEGFVNIDPMAYDDPATGKRLLYWGSGFGPIKVRELAEDRISFLEGSPTIDLVPVDPADDPDNYQRLVEGAWITFRDGWYYLFYSGDNCCGPNAHYATMVARSRNATGPFTTLAQARGVPGSVILAADAQWNAPGHNAVVEDAAGNHWIIYHAVDRENPRAKPDADPNTRRIMLVDRLIWRDGWPHVAGQATE